MSALDVLKQRLHENMGEGGELPWPDEWIGGKREAVHLLNIALAAQEFIKPHEDCYCEISSPCMPCIARKKAMARAIVVMEGEK